MKNVEPVGGSPVLLQAAEDAVYKWKFAAAAAESKELSNCTSIRRRRSAHRPHFPETSLAIVASCMFDVPS